ncbi:MAG: cell division protein ZapA [Bacteroidetes bacterium]|nr:cell division protein ZapA [Bacteroidota bacterium]
MSNLIPISAVIGDRSYRIKIQPQDEEVVRKTLKMINDKILEFRTLFAGKDMQDYIAMVIIWFATEQIAQQAAGIENEELQVRMDKIEALLDEMMGGLGNRE